MKTALAALIVGYGLDLLLGDPSFLYHPIRVIGNLIALLEKWLRKVFPKTPKGELAGGVFLVILVCLAGYGVPALLLCGALLVSLSACALRHLKFIRSSASFWRFSGAGRFRQRNA